VQSAWYPGRAVLRILGLAFAIAAVVGEGRLGQRR
jgi:hypothetical protein